MDAQRMDCDHEARLLPSDSELPPTALILCRGPSVARIFCPVYHHMDATLNHLLNPPSRLQKLLAPTIETMSENEHYDSSPWEHPRDVVKEDKDILPGLRTLSNQLQWGGNLLVYVTLLATLLFTVSINMPGGYWQDDEILHKKGDPVPNLPGVFYASTVYGHRAGNPVLRDEEPLRYYIIRAFSGFGFYISVLTTSIVLSLITDPNTHEKYIERPRFRLVKWGIKTSFTCALICLLASEPIIPPLAAVAVSFVALGIYYAIVKLSEQW